MGNAAAALLWRPFAAAAVGVDAAAVMEEEAAKEGHLLRLLTMLPSD